MSTRLAPSPDADRESVGLTSSKDRLVEMLYDGACRFLEQGALAMREGDIAASHAKLRRGEAIISHLQHTLAMEQGDIAKNLLAIYPFCHRHLNRARIERDPGKVEEVVGLLRQLRSHGSAGVPARHSGAARYHQLAESRQPGRRVDLDRFRGA